MAFLIPTIPDEEIGNIPDLIFGPDHWLHERYDDPEVQGGKIALIAYKQIGVQKPPSFLDHMQSRYLKQVAYNDRIIQAEKEIAAINADIPEFLSGMNLDPNDQVVIVVNGSEEMKRAEAAFAGQFWMQGDRHMTAANPVLKGDPTSREAAILSAMYEAVAWKHSLETVMNGPRKGQRVIIYPKELTGIAQVLSTRNVTVQDDLEDHSELYSAILTESDMFEKPPLFVREDSDEITSHLVWAVEIAKWMFTAAKVATGSRPRVLEDGPDMVNSDDEDAKKDDHGEELRGVYAPGCLSLEQAWLTEEQAQAQRAATFSSSMTFPEPERKPTPMGTPVNSDEEDMSYDQQRGANLGKKMAGRGTSKKVISPPRSSISIPDPEVQAPAKAPPLEITKAMNPVIISTPPPRSPSSPEIKASTKKSGTKKAAASQKAPADQPTGAKAPTPTKGQAKGQESPGTKVPPPMQTRSQAKQEDASRAGGLRGVAGSGQIGAACGSSSPARKPGS
jgi:hypothetical protein